MRFAWLPPTIALFLRQSRDPRGECGDHGYTARWHAARAIQRNARAALARWKIAQAMCVVWSKEFDSQAERYTFTHTKTRETQYHKPWGMRMADLWSCCSCRVGEPLLCRLLGVGVSVFDELKVYYACLSRCIHGPACISSRLEDNLFSSRDVTGGVSVITNDTTNSRCTNRTNCLSRNKSGSAQLRKDIRTQYFVAARCRPYHSPR